MDTTTHAFALMRRLYQSYDAGGHSARSQRSRLLEGALFRFTGEVPKITLHVELLKEMAALAEETRKEEPPQLSLPLELQHLSLPEYTCVVLLALEAVLEEHGEEIT